MKKHKILGIALVIFILSIPLSAMANNSVNKLKHLHSNSAETYALFEEILDQGTASVGDLLTLLKEDMPIGDPAAAKQLWAAKVTAMNLLGEMKAKSALNPLEEMLKYSDHLSAIFNAGRTIGRIGGPKASKILEETLLQTADSYDPINSARKRSTIVGMGLCENQEAIPLLLGELNNTYNAEIVRIYAAGSLGILGNNDGLDLVTAGLDSNDPAIRMAAVRVIGFVGDDNSIQDLNAAVGPNAESGVRRAAKMAATQIKAARLTGDEKVNFIKNELAKNSRDTFFLQWGTMKLKKAKSPAATEALEELASKPGREMALLRQAARIRMKSDQ